MKKIMWKKKMVVIKRFNVIIVSNGGTQDVQDPKFCLKEKDFWIFGERIINWFMNARHVMHTKSCIK